MTIHVYLHDSQEPGTRDVLDRILADLKELHKGQTKIMSKVTEYANANIEAFNHINQKLDDISQDEKALLDILTQIQNNPGPISAEDQELLDQALALQTATVAKVDALAAFEPPPAPVA